MNYSMRQRSLFHLTMAILLLGTWACQNDGADHEREVQEIQSEGKISSIIRNPITAAGIGDTMNLAKMTFQETSFDFGETKEGDVVEHTFKFKNTGTVPLIITEAHSTCGCTVPRWPKEPTPPGQEGEIKVSFNTLNKTGTQEKQVTITANTYPSITLVFVKGFVHKKS